MPDWRQEYLAGLSDAEKQKSPLNHELIAAYSQLLDRVSVLEAEKAALQLQSGTGAPTSPSPSAPPPTSGGGGAAAADEPALVARLRLELAEALRSNTQLQRRAQTAEDELARLRAKSAAEGRAVRELTAERRTLAVKLRDREEELRAKNKLVAEVQDELAVLNMQLDLVERRRAEQEAENKQLVERFMQRVGQEAEALNLASEPLFSRRR
ncbi:uncharacterized protein THITE_2146125 [Thermothielavioides terrestris NRRL 8126]|uniref:Autophagy-related protein 16 domain-containing protein n=1 Tax=Thermothielavioides terrestris (strain ATCC 38088 / NRRL 8126) TaxID=578455 RepID=G2RBD1_THETT|nr:uncharacterized protein THITE_2146125 [Thermothielavioides terrestris NRRL 8126]AEO69102.1 hypothetical protein THITE_2146125 [Thermothielavioides terrestris NRRL 8126]